MLYFIFALIVAPVSGKIVHVSIVEEVPIGTVVSQLKNGGEFSLYDVNEQYFSLSYDGIITTKSRIDRESEPFNDPNKPYELKIRHSQSLIQVLVEVIDINDNKPLFKIKEETFTFSENAQLVDEEQLPEAIDADWGINSTQGYRIKSGNIDNTFEIVSIKAVNRKFYYLKLKRALDREHTPEFNLVVEAYDGAYPAKRDELNVRVIIQDENDCSPEFNQTHYYATVREDANNGYRVLTVKATDRDSGSNSRIIYSMDADFNGDNKFMINRKSGDITLQGHLDYETEPEIFLIAIATDEGSPPRSSKVFVNINVVDVNDNQPLIEIIYKSATDTEAQVDEDSSPDSPVVTIRVTDADSGEAGRVICEMDSDMGLEYFKLVHNDALFEMWNVRVRKPPRRDVAKEYTLSITCRDNGVPQQRVSFMTFKVKIVDINDHYPMFAPVSYSLSLPENTAPGTDIITVSASDNDDGDFGQITYKIKSVSVQASSSSSSSSTDPLSWFSIHPKEGTIRNLVKLDREKTPDINMIVQAIDGGEPPNGPHIATATVAITLLDENDNIPVFSQDLVETSVRNDAVVGTDVVHVRARDFDDGAYGAVTYDLEPSGGSRYFKIHPTTGQIKTAQPLPSTDYQVIELTVLATDGGGQQGSCHISISIFGDNLYAPHIQHREYSISVNENVLPPKLLLTVVATDRDLMYFGEVHYELLGKFEKFEIGRETGELRLVNPLDYETERMYRFEVRTFNNYDGTLDKKEDRATISVIVNDVNDEPPRFEYERYNLTAYTEEKNGTVIDTIRAVDPDSADNGLVTYRIVGGNDQDLFQLSSTAEGAKIRINGNLAYMVGKVVNVILEAQDMSEDSFNGHRTVLWIRIAAGRDPGRLEEVARDQTWFDRYLPFIIGAIVIISLVFLVVIVVVCNRANKQVKLQYTAKLPNYDGYEYADLDEQYGLEPDTVKAYNIDGGGECDRLSAFEALTNQLQSLQHDYLSDKGPNNYYGYPDNTKVVKSHIDSEGYFSLSDPDKVGHCDPRGGAEAGGPPRGGAEGGGPPRGAEGGGPLGPDTDDVTLASLLNNHNIYKNIPHPVKCETKYVPLSPPPDHVMPLYGHARAETPDTYHRSGERAGAGEIWPSQEAQFVRSLPPLENSFLPMSPETSEDHVMPLYGHVPGSEDHVVPLYGHVPGSEDHVMPLYGHVPGSEDHVASLSSLISSQSRPNEITRLPTTLMAANQSDVLGPLPNQSDVLGSRANQSDGLGPRANQSDVLGSLANQSEVLGPRANQSDVLGPLANQNDVLGSRDNSNTRPETLSINSDHSADF